MGENLYMMRGTPAPKLKGGESCASWYSEINFYDFATGNMKAGSPAGTTIGGWHGFVDPHYRLPLSITGHFTQSVWKTSIQLGLGVGCSSKGDVHVVGNYFLGGNYWGQNLANVPKLL